MGPVASRIGNDVSCLTHSDTDRHRSVMRVIFRGRCNVWWCWGTASVSPRSVNDFSYVAGINRECYLVVQSMVCSMEYYFVVQSRVVLCITD